jgi:sulfur-oxidizing protein SoxA
MPPWGKHGFYSDGRDPRHGALPQDAEDAREVRQPARRSGEAAAAGRGSRRARSVRQSGGRAHRGRRALFKQACAPCHATPEPTFKRWAVEMPKWEPRLNKVLGAEEFIARHAKATSGATWLMQSRENTDMSIYLHSLANGEPIKVDLGSPEAKAAYDRGVKLADLKLGQFDFACTDCHGQAANKWIRGQWLGEPKGQFDHFPLWRTSRNEVWDIRKRLQWCNVQVRANELPPMRLNMASWNSICAR